MTEYADAPPDIVDELRSVCLGLPETVEEKAWAGTRWRVRKRTFAHVLEVDRKGAEGPVCVLTFRSASPELEALQRAGHPFFLVGWGRDVVGMVIDAGVDWDEVAELLTESYCLLAPKKLVAQVDRPPI